MNIINAGNPSANNMIIRQVMQKKRQSSATIFDKLNKRTAKLTAKNPLNNVLTNDQLFRYYIQEVEPKLSQSNDNFQGLPNMTPSDNSIKDTTEKDFRDGYNAGSGGGGGGFGPLNSNDISGMTPIPPSDPYIEPARPPQRAPPARPTRSLYETFARLPWQEQDAMAIELYNNNRQALFQLIRDTIVDAGGEANPENIQLMMSHIERNLLGIVPNVPNNDPDRIKQEIVPKVIPPRTKQEIVPLQQNPNPNWSTEQQNNVPNVNDVYDVLSYDFQTHLNNRKNNYLSNQLSRPMTLDDVIYERHAQDLGFDDPMSYYGRSEEDWPEAGIDEEAGVSMNLPSFDISNPNYNPRANDGERQFQLIGTPRSVGTERSKRANRRADFISSQGAASGVVPFQSPISSSIVPRTALLGRAPWGSQSASLLPRQDSALRRELNIELPPLKLDERFEDLFGV